MEQDTVALRCRETDGSGNQRGLLARAEMFVRELPAAIERTWIAHGLPPAHDELKAYIDALPQGALTSEGLINAYPVSSRRRDADDSPGVLVWFVVGAYSRALRQYEDGCELKAWPALLEGYMIQAVLQRPGKKTFKDLAVLGADARHAVMRDKKNRAIDAYKSGKFQSKNRAAELLAVEYSVSVRTMRGWFNNI